MTNPLVPALAIVTEPPGAFDDFALFQATDLATPMPLRRLYDNAAYHYARFFLLQTDGQDERADGEYKLFEHEIGKSNRRLRGNVKDKVKRMY